MTKGKYAARSARRREDADVQSEIGGYQHHVQRLTAENKDLKQKLADLRKEFQTETRRLRAERDEGLSPEISALRNELARQRERADEAVRDAKYTRERQDTLRQFTSKLLHDITGCTGLEATEALLRAVPGVNPETVITFGVSDTPGADRNDTSPVTTIQRARGWRSSPKVIEHLNDLVARAASKSAKVRRAQ